jgi:hypothetical protein
MVLKRDGSEADACVANIKFRKAVARGKNVMRRFDSLNHASAIAEASDRE